MSFEVTILGSGGALPTLNRNSTAQFVTCCNRHILIDCGEGTQLQMRKFGVHFQRLDIILISHLHGDHFFGLVGLLSTMRLLGRDGKLTIICPKGLPAIIYLQIQTVQFPNSNRTKKADLSQICFFIFKYYLNSIITRMCDNMKG